MLSVITICWDEGYEYADQHPHKGLHLAGDAETDFEAHMPDIDDGQDEQVREKGCISLEKELQRNDPEESGHGKHHNQQGYGDTDPVFLSNLEIHPVNAS